MPGAILTNSINSNLVILMSKAPGYWPALSSHSHLTRLRFRRHLHFYSLGQSLVWWWTIDSWLSKQWTLENGDSRKMNYESVTFLFIWILYLVIFSISLLSSDLFLHKIYIKTFSGSNNLVCGRHVRSGFQCIKEETFVNWVLEI